MVPQWNMDFSKVRSQRGVSSWSFTQADWSCFDSAASIVRLKGV